MIGAGLAGLACANALRDAGWTVTVLEKGRGPGGRTSTRREGTWRFDHGAPRLELGAPELGQLRARWEAAGVIVPWQARLRGAGAAPEPHTTTWLGAPGSSALTAHLARDLDVRTGNKVIALVQQDGHWLLDLEHPRATERLGPFDHVVLTAPAPQTLELLATTHAARDLSRSLGAAQFAPCLAAMVIVRPTGDVAFDELRLAAGPLASAHRMDHRPGRVATERGLQAWVLHGSEAWSVARLEDPGADVTAELTDAFQREVPGELLEARGHRWRYARATARVGAPCAHDPTLALGVAGDWFEAGERAPASSRALLSGISLARLLVSSTDA